MCEQESAWSELCLKGCLVAVSGVDWSEGHKVCGGLKESGGRGTGEHRANEEGPRGSRTGEGRGGRGGGGGTKMWNLDSWKRRGH